MHPLASRLLLCIFSAPLSFETLSITSFVIDLCAGGKVCFQLEKLILDSRIATQSFECACVFRKCSKKARMLRFKNCLAYIWRQAPTVVLSFLKTDPLTSLSVERESLRTIPQIPIPRSYHYNSIKAFKTTALQGLDLQASGL